MIPKRKKSQIIESPPRLFECVSAFLWVILTKIETLTIVIKYKPIKSQADVILTFVSQVFLTIFNFKISGLCKFGRSFFLGWGREPSAQILSRE